MIQTVSGSSSNDDKHQAIIDFAISSGNLYLGIKHFINNTHLTAPNIKEFNIYFIYICNARLHQASYIYKIYCNVNIYIYIYIYLLYINNVLT